MSSLTFNIMLNSFGRLLRIHTFGESHGPATGVIVDGFPSNIEIDESFIMNEMRRRRPGQSSLTTSRKEKDRVEILSGVFEGRSTGTPIMLLIRNENAQSKDYEHLRNTFRPSHADFTYRMKYGNRDFRGGGRSSARETASWVAAGALAKLALQKVFRDIEIRAFVSSVGNISLTKPVSDIEFPEKENKVRCPDPETAERMIALIEEVKAAGDTIGGIVSCRVRGISVGLGEPVFGKLHAALGAAMLSINAVKGFEYGSGFEGTRMRGSEHNDIFMKKGDSLSAKTNYSGGVQGGISNGEEIYFRVAFKPVATLMQDQISADAEGNDKLIEGKGRHDPCVVPRAVPITEAMTALVLLDFWLMNRSRKDFENPQF